MVIDSTNNIQGSILYMAFECYLDITIATIKLLFNSVIINTYSSCNNIKSREEKTDFVDELIS